ncbi:MAG TPA: Hint domain-containing protein, partial [Rhodopila sp.]|nr:Hint domain-containing protein [Rhodopila sp.]
GTRITTPRGSVAVERLREGDTVLTVSGKRQKITWIGRRTLDCRRHVAPERVMPVRIAPHAFGENRPQRALLLSPDHSVFVEDVLIPAKHLVNGTTVTRVDVASVTYYHVELPRHDVVLAEGLPAETYLETGARCAFENGGGALQLHADFAPDEERVGMVWQNFGYAPLIGRDGQLDRVRARLALQAAMLGYLGDGGVAPRRRQRLA